MKLSKGDTLWFVEDNESLMRPIILSKIGRAWAYSDDLRGYRIDTYNMSVFAGNGFHGKCYRTREEYEMKLMADRKWTLLQREISRVNRPSNLRIENIDAAAKLLGIELS